MSLMIIVIGAVAIGLVCGWIYAGFPLLRLGSFSTSAREPDAIGETGVPSDPPRPSSPLARVLGMVIGVRAWRLAFVGAAVSAALLVIQSVPAGAQASQRCFGHTATEVGTAKRDRIEGTQGRDVIVGLGGNDTLVGFDGNDFLLWRRGQ